MRFTIQLRITDNEGCEIATNEIISLDKHDDRLEAIGLSLGEAKDLLSHLQQHLVQAQAASYVADRQRCEHCGRPFRSKGHYPMSFRTPFGTVEVASPRFHCCGCQPANSKTFSRSAQRGPSRSGTMSLVWGPDPEQTQVGQMGDPKMDPRRPTGDHHRWVPIGEAGTREARLTSRATACKVRNRCCRGHRGRGAPDAGA